MEIETEKSFALSTAAVSNITTTLKPEDENLLREKAVHNMRTGVYTTEVEMCLWNRPDNACKLPSRRHDICQMFYPTGGFGAKILHGNA